ncbi:MAG TPA: HEAT repeat domain-containing protein [Chloroflexia bacterium]|nr:HEAT repeat domain-containing protein [Chloroflexia bacterium]
MLPALLALGGAFVASSVGRALFLSALPVTAIPYKFLLPAFGIVLSMVLYHKGAGRYRLDRLNRAVRGGLLAGTVLIWILLVSPSGHSLAVLAGAVSFFEIMAALITAQVWFTASTLLQGREDKRLFGLVGGTTAIASTGAGALLLLLGPWVTPEAFLLAVVGALAGSLVTGRHAPPLPPPAPAGTRSPRRGFAIRDDLRALGRAPLVRTLTGIVSMMALVASLTTYQLDLALKALAPVPAAQLLAALGLLQLGTGLGACAVQVYLTNRLIDRVGAVAALRLMPSVSALGAAVILLTGGPLAIVALAQGAALVLRYTLNDVALNMLFVPLAADQRRRARAILDSIVVPLVFGAAGLAFFWVPAIAAWAIAAWSLPALAVIVGWRVLVSHVRQPYLLALTDNVQKRRFTADDQAIDISPATAPVLINALQHPDELQVLHALQLLANAPKLNWDAHVVTLLDHPSTAVRIMAVHYLGRPDNTAYAEPIAALFTTAEEPVRAAAIEAFCELNGPDALARVRPFLQESSPRLQGAAVFGMMKYGGLYGMLDAMGQFKRLLASSDPASRLEGTRVLGALQVQNYYPRLLPLLEDDAIDVQIGAIRAAGQMGSQELIPFLVRKLAQKATAAAAAVALAQYGATIAPALGLLLSDAREAPAIREQIPKILRRIGTPAAVAILADHLSDPTPAIRTEILRALVRLRLVAPGLVRPDALQEVLAAEMRAAYTLAGLQADLGPAAAEPLLSDAIAARREQVQDRIFLVLSILYPDQPIESVRRSVDWIEGPMRTQALVLLTHLITREVRDLLLPLIEGAPAQVVEIAHKRLGVPSKPLATRLEELAQSPDPWLRACAVYSIGTHQLHELAGTVQAALADDDPVVRETAHGALGSNHMSLSTIERVLFLRGVDLFSEVHSEDLVHVAQIAQEVNFAAGETFIKQGDIGDCLYIILDGEVQIRIAGLGAIAERHPKSIIGEMAIVSRTPRTADCIAATDTTALKIDHADFWELLGEKPQLAYGVIRVLAHRLDEAVNNLHKRGHALSEESAAG